LPLTTSPYDNTGMSADDEIRIRPKRDPDEPTSEIDLLVYARWFEFVERLASRQASKPMDLKALYKRKAELDRHLQT
jgi:hypothetical protein